MRAPVVVFVYKRLQHTRKTIESLMKNTLASETDVYIYSDGYKGENDYNDVIEVRNYIRSLKEAHPFSKLEVIEAPKNQGLANSVIKGTTEVINKYKKIISVEDDLLLSPYFLEYMNEALDVYQNEPKVWSIGSHSTKLPFMNNYEYDVYFCHRASSWGWGTWKDRWDTVDWSMKDYPSFKFNLRERKRFNLGGQDMASLLDRQMCGVKDSWAIRWCYAQYKMNSYCVRPVEPLIINIGQDGSGTHCKKNLYPDAKMSEKQSWIFPVFSYNKEIERQYAESGKVSSMKLLGSFLIFAVCKGKIYWKKK